MQNGTAPLAGFCKRLLSAVRIMLLEAQPPLINTEQANSLFVWIKWCLSSFKQKVLTRPTMESLVAGCR